MSNALQDLRDTYVMRTVVYTADPRVFIMRSEGNCEFPYDFIHGILELGLCS